MLKQQGVLTQHATLAGVLFFEQPGYIEITNEEYDDCRISMAFNRPSAKIGLVPKYLSDGNHLFVEVDGDGMLRVFGVIKGAQKKYGEADVGNVLADYNRLTVKDIGSHFSILLNGFDIMSIQSNTFHKGSIRIYGDAQEEVHYCIVEQEQSKYWVSDNPGLEKIQEGQDGRFKMKIKGLAELEGNSYQTLSLDAGEKVLSFISSGNGAVRIENLNGVMLNETIIGSEIEELREFPFVAGEAGNVTLRFSTNDELTFSEVQIEAGNHRTDYIKNESGEVAAVREASLLSYPLKRSLDTKSGTVYLSVSTDPSFEERIAGNRQKFLETDDQQMEISYEAGSLIFRIGTDEVLLQASLNGKTTEIYATWHENKMTLTADGNTGELQGVSGLQEGVERFVFAKSDNIFAPLVMEEWALFKTVIDASNDIKNYLPFAVMHSLFDGGISGKDVSWTELPVAPHDHSPILVEKEDGSVMQKVSFFDDETGEYRTWNREAFYYDGRSDYVELAYSNINDQFRGIGLWTEDGEKIGEPYRIDGKRLYFEMYEATREYHRNKWLYATYQVNDTYTIDQNIEAPDGYRIDFANHEGGNRVVIQEGNRYGESVKLATMIELNPIQNQNHEGFLYVTETSNQAENFRITASRDRLVADGGESTTIFIEVLDHQGNYLSYPNLEVKARYGFITRLTLKEAADSQRRAGQYFYHYTAPFIERKREGELMEDHIWVIDRTSNIGMSHKIILAPAEAAARLQMKEEEKERLKQKEELMNAIIAYESVERYAEPELVDILDLNGDGRITTEDILPLETNEKDAELRVRINQLREWVATKDALETS